MIVLAPVVFDRILPLIFNACFEMQKSCSLYTHNTPTVETLNKFMETGFMFHLLKVSRENIKGKNNL